MSGHDLYTQVVCGVCGNDHPDDELENQGYNVALGPMHKFGAEYCGRTGRIDVENTPCEYVSPEDALILLQEGVDDNEVSDTDWMPSLSAEIASRREQVFDDEPDPSEGLAGTAGNRKRRRLRRPLAARIATWMIQGSNQAGGNPPWVNPKIFMGVYITP